MQHRDSQLFGQQVLGVIRPKGAGYHNGIGLTELGCIVPDVNFRTDLPQALGVG